MKKHLRILAVNWRDKKNPAAGGAEIHLHEIIERLARRGHEVTLLAAGFPESAVEEHYDGLRVLRAGNEWNANFALFWRARRLLRQERFDLILEDVNKIPFFLPLMSKLPHLLVIPHLFGGTVFKETNPLFATYVYLPELLIPRIYARSLVLAISPSTRDDLIRRGLAAERIGVSFCGFDPAPYQLPQIPPRDAKPRLIHLGRLRKYKGADIVLKAFVEIRKQLPEAGLDIVGDGPERPALIRLARELGLGESVRFHGFVDLSKMIELLYRSHLFLNASPKEGWGLTVVEAAACGVPCVAADSPGLRDSVIDGTTGILVPYGDVQAMAAASIELLQDPQRLARMSEQAGLRAREFSWDKTADEAEAMLRRLTAEQGDRSV